jgi:putative ABC transport system substrate-binding protein
MGRKIFCFALCALLFTLSEPIAAQPTRIPRIGYLAGFAEANRPGLQVEAFRRGLRELGYIEGENILVEYRYVEGKPDRIPSLIAELVNLNIDVLISASGGSADRAAKQATKTIPVILVTTQDPVATGIVDSLARPGGNITGLTRFTRDLSAKRLELLKEAVPKISRVGVLWSTGNAPQPLNSFQSYDAAAYNLKIRLQSLEVSSSKPDLERVFRDADKVQVSALVIVTGPLLVRHLKKVTDLTIKNRLPSMYEGSEYVEAGGLLSYAANDSENFRRAAVYVDKILKGAKPGDLPVEQPTKFELVVNLKTAKQIGLTIPPNVLARANRVIR